MTERAESREERVDNTEGFGLTLDLIVSLVYDFKLKMCVDFAEANRDPNKE